MRKGRISVPKVLAQELRPKQKQTQKSRERVKSKATLQKTPEFFLKAAREQESGKPKETPPPLPTPRLEQK